MAAGLNLPGTRSWPPAELTVANPLIWTITVLNSPAFERETRYPCGQGPKGQFLRASAQRAMALLKGIGTSPGPGTRWEWFMSECS